MQTIGSKEKQKEKRKNKITLIIVIITIIAIIFLGIFLFFYFKNKKDINNTVEANTQATLSNEETDSKTEYYNEVHYIGGIGYKEVYESPFKKTNIYVSNKTLWNNSEEQGYDISKDFEKMINISNQYINLVFNTGYRNIQSDKENFKNQLCELIKNNTLYSISEDETEDFTKEYLAEYIANYLIDNEISCEANFRTDSSLIYFDSYYYYLRGILELTVYNSNESTYFGCLPKGEVIPIMIEFKLSISEDNLDYKVIDVSDGLLINEENKIWGKPKTYYGSSHIINIYF